jgi:hypothetical protein
MFHLSFPHHIRSYLVIIPLSFFQVPPHDSARWMGALSTHKTAVSAFDTERSKSVVVLKAVPTLPSMGEYAEGTVLSSRNVLLMTVRTGQRMEECAGSTGHK